MSNDYQDNNILLTDNEWIRCMLVELEEDCVEFSVIIDVASKHFGLSECDLEKFVYKCIDVLKKAGAKAYVFGPNKGISTLIDMNQDISVLKNIFMEYYIRKNEP